MAKKRRLTQTPTPTTNPEPQEHPQDEQITDATAVAEDQIVEDQTPQTLDPTTNTAVNGAATTDDQQQQEEEEVEEEEEKNEELCAETIHKILDLLPKDQLVDLLRSAAVNHPDVRNQILKIAESDPTFRKIFVFGLGWDTTAQILTDFFSQYGEIEDCKAVTDKITNKSKGYAFILFKTRRGAENALKEPQKKIGSRTATCQLASVGPTGGNNTAATAAPAAQPAAQTAQSEFTQRKIFVSNVGAEMDPQKLLQFFAKFGEIEDGPLGLDKTTGKPRGFCLFVYKTVESAKKALEEPHKNFEGQMLHCQRAIDGPKNSKQGYGYQNQHVGSGPKGNFAGGVGGHVPGAGHLMAPGVGGMGYNQPVPGAINPTVNQALTALLLGGLGSAAGPVVNQGVPGQMGSSGYGSGQMGGLGGYGGPAAVQGGYGGAQMGQGGGARGQQGGYGHAGGGPPYMGHH